MIKQIVKRHGVWFFLVRSAWLQIFSSIELLKCARMSYLKIFVAACPTRGGREKYIEVLRWKD
jgi:hypothetical protein